MFKTLLVFLHFDEYKKYMATDFSSNKSCHELSV